VNWIHLAEDLDQWQALVTTLICLLLAAGLIACLLFDTDNGGSTFLRNVDGFLPDYMV
jgi:hypothetical protein